MGDASSAAEYRAVWRAEALGWAHGELGAPRWLCKSPRVWVAVLAGLALLGFLDSVLLAAACSMGVYVGLALASAAAVHARTDSEATPHPFQNKS